LVDAYREARGSRGAGDEALADLDALERALVALHARGAAAHPRLSVDGVTFAAHLGRCGADIERLHAADLHAEDLYLCCAGLRGDAEAVRDLRARHRTVLPAYLRNIDRSAAFLDEVEQRLWDAALIGSVEASPKLASYAGRGPLAAWIGIAAQRIALMIRRREAAEKRALDNVGVEARLATADPELAFVKEHLREPFQRAIIAAFKTLDDRQRMIYSLHVVDGLTMERIAGMYGVSHSTVSRWMSSAREAIVAEARRQLRDEMNVAADEFESLTRLLVNDLDLSVSLVLGEMG
jgi:RNA polymerase sigma-70 factor (ECF subfamily)